MDLKGKTAIITGGDRGIGKAISLALADRGVNAAVVYKSNKKGADDVCRQISAKNLRAIALQADLSDYAQVKKMVNKAAEEFGTIDILINNAGITGRNRTIETIDIDDWNRVISVNLSGAFYCCKAAAKYLKESKGKIVSISSIAAKVGGALGCHYAASKAGLLGLTFALTGEFAPYVTVNAVAPGPVNTDLIDPVTKKELAQKTPFGRIAAAGEIAHAVIFLLENDYISGEVIDVNAGRHPD